MGIGHFMGTYLCLKCLFYYNHRIFTTVSHLQEQKLNLNVVSVAPGQQKAQYTTKLWFSGFRQGKSRTKPDNKTT